MSDFGKLLEHLGQSQEAGFDRLTDLLSGVADVVLETHVAVLDIQQELRKVAQIVLRRGSREDAPQEAGGRASGPRHG